VGKEDDDFGLVSMTAFNLNILLAITFLLVVLIHFAFTPIFRRPQKNLVRALPIFDFLLVCKVQFNALMLSVTHETTECGSSLTFQDVNVTRDAQKFRMMVTYY